MRKITFSPEVTLGNLLQVLTILLAVISTWFAIIGRISILEKDAVKMDRLVEKITITNDKIVETIQQMRENQSRIATILEERTHKIP